MDIPLYQTFSRLFLDFFMKQTEEAKQLLVTFLKDNDCPVPWLEETPLSEIKFEDISWDAELNIVGHGCIKHLVATQGSNCKTQHHEMRAVNRFDVHSVIVGGRVTWTWWPNGDGRTHY